MHIPDGFLSAETSVATGALAAAGLGVALRQARLHLPPRRVPLLGLAASFVFAAQMINFPVAGGTSGHVVGAVLAAVLLGPSAAVVVISSVLIVQCLMFADGGLSALGANIFNMGLLGGVGGWAIYHVVSRRFGGLFGCVLAAAFAGWSSTVLASIACAGELAASGTARWSAVLPAMAGVHMIIGIGEGLITALVVVAVARARPELLQPAAASEATAARPAAVGTGASVAAAVTAPTTASRATAATAATATTAASAATAATEPGRPYGVIVAYGGLIALGLALFASPLASRWPDGLDRVAEVLGFKEKAAGPLLPAPIPEYEVPGVDWGPLGTSIAGAVGTIVVFVLAWVLARVLVPEAGRVEGSEARGAVDARHADDAKYPDDARDARDLGNPSRPRDLDSPRDTDSARHRDSPGDLGGPSELDTARDLDTPRDLDSPRHPDSPGDLDSPRDSRDAGVAPDPSTRP